MITSSVASIASPARLADAARAHEGASLPLLRLASSAETFRGCVYVADLPHAYVSAPDRTTDRLPRGSGSASRPLPARGVAFEGHLAVRRVLPAARAHELQTRSHRPDRAALGVPVAHPSVATASPLLVRRRASTRPRSDEARHVVGHLPLGVGALRLGQRRHVGALVRELVSKPRVLPHGIGLPGPVLLHADAARPHVVGESIRRDHDARPRAARGVDLALADGHADEPQNRGAERAPMYGRRRAARLRVRVPLPGGHHGRGGAPLVPLVPAHSDSPARARRGRVARLHRRLLGPGCVGLSQLESLPRGRLRQVQPGPRRSRVVRHFALVRVLRDGRRSGSSSWCASGSSGSPNRRTY